MIKSARYGEARFQSQINTPTIDMIKDYILKDAGIKNKSPNEQKRIIQAYVKKVTFPDNELKILLIVDIDGGGEGSRTPVRRHTHESISGRSQCIDIPSPGLPLAGYRLW